MKITGWTWYENPEYKGITTVDCTELKEMIATEMRSKGYKFSGHYHQYGEFGTPIIDNGWKFTVSQRAWGRMMALAYPDEIDDSDGYGYCDWAWMTPDGETMVVPKEGDYER